MDFYVKEEWRAPAAVGVAAFLSGIGVGYLAHKKRHVCLPVDEAATMAETMDAAADIIEDQTDEIEQQRKLDFARAAGQAAHRGLVRDRPVVVYQGEPIEEADPEPEMADAPDDGWNQQEEEEERSPDSPYVISRDEFIDNKHDFTQVDLEYFAGDNVLCDDKRVPIYNPAKVVGRLEFGRGSGDPNTVYIRNETVSAEYAVIRIEGTYQMEVLGLEAEEAAEDEEEAHLKHSAVLKFRMD